MFRLPSPWHSQDDRAWTSQGTCYSLPRRCAHLAGLRRTAAGPFTIDRAISLDALEALPPEDRDARLLPADALVAGWPSVALQADEAGRFLTGLRRRIERADAERVRVYGPVPTHFLGIGRIAGGELIATRLLSPAEIQS